VLHRKLSNDTHVVIIQKVKLWKAITCAKVVKLPEHVINFVM
jgi:hypothetical protein